MVVAVLLLVLTLFLILYLRKARGRARKGKPPLAKQTSECLAMIKRPRAMGSRLIVPIFFTNKETEARGDVAKIPWALQWLRSCFARAAGPTVLRTGQFSFSLTFEVSLPKATSSQCQFAQGWYSRTH